MLLEISIENFKSFSEKQTFNMYAVNQGNIKNSTLNAKYYGENKKLNNIKLYNTSVIYGLNNSGKSNFITAISYINKILKYSWQQGLPNKKEAQYFRLDNKYKNKPSKFEIIFIAKDNIKYQYSFSLDNNRIYEEKLIAYPKGQKKLYFERKFDDIANDYIYDTKNLVGNSPSQIEDLKGNTRKDCLFLSTAMQFGNKFLEPVIKFITEKIIFISNMSLESSMLIDILELISNNNEFKNIYKAILGDKNLVDIEVSDQELTLQQQQILQKQLEITPIELQDNIKKQFEYAKKHIIFVKKDNDNNIIRDYFDIETTESSGTRVLLNILAILFILNKDGGGILFFDELDRSLHPKILILLIKLIYHMNWNIQLVFTAHNTIFLKNQMNVFKKYQVWFVDKDYSGNSVLYSAGATSVRNELDLEKLYFNGRFTDIPEEDILLTLENKNA